MTTAEIEKVDVRTGSCLCGAVRVRARTPNPQVTACHCTQCRRWTGGGPLTSVRAELVEMTGETHIGTYRASEWGERAFCRDCGSTLYWRMQGKPIAFLAAGLFDDQTGFTVVDEIFIDHRPAWLPTSAHAKQVTEAEELAKLHATFEGAAK